MLLSGEIELDEVYIVAGHKGHPEIVAKLGRAGRRRRLKGKRGRGTLADEKPPIFGMLQRDGAVVIAMLPNVQRVTIAPLIQQTIQAGSRLYTDEYDIYNQLGESGYAHKTVNHSAGEYARDEDGDGFHEVHVNTWKDSGLCCVRGFGRIGACLKKNCRCTWVSLSSCTMSAAAARPCWPHSWRFW